MRRIAHSPRSALAIAIERGCRLEAITSRSIKTRSVAEDKVPAGGLLVKEEDGRFMPLALIPIPDEDPEQACMARHLKGGH